MIDECIKAGELKGFNVWKRTYATNVGGESDWDLVSQELWELVDITD
ncbi:MAG: hypothetical protein IPL20_15505 [Saprospiraceae bacterium]|nr:hypothetical protein [Saprospiraceae bacterium]